MTGRRRRRSNGDRTWRVVKSLVSVDVSTLSVTIFLHGSAAMAEILIDGKSAMILHGSLSGHRRHDSNLGVIGAGVDVVVRYRCHPGADRKHAHKSRISRVDILMKPRTTMDVMEESLER